LKFRAFIRNACSPVWLLNGRMDTITRDILTASVASDSHWLDVGCGLKPFVSSFKDASYTGIDVKVSGRADELKLPDKYFDGVNIPYEDCMFDGILSTQVLEHVENLDILLSECKRVLKPGGYFIVSVPFVYKEHETPHDYRRFTSYGLEKTLLVSGFKIDLCLKCLSSIETVATLFSVYIANNIGAKNKVLYILTGLFITMPVLVISKYLSKILPDNGDLYCTLIVNSFKSKTREE
jgi:SAM-dependent methyltransferase